MAVVGGGIFGACAAWEAASRGLSVVLLEQGDFSHATSANHFKMVHGGIRYLQHGDLPRIYKSSRERSAMLRTCPHLVQPLPIVIPTHGHGVKGKLFLGLGMYIYDVLTCRRNKGIQKSRKIPWSSFLSKSTLQQHFPDLGNRDLTGAAVFYDGQMYNAPRLALAFIRSAACKGARVANYAEVTDFLLEGRRVTGVRVHDVLTGDTHAVRARIVLNTAGPWAHRLLTEKLQVNLAPTPNFSRDLAFVIKRRFKSPYGLALLSGSKDADSMLDRGGRHLFLVPWREYTLVGVWHKIFTNRPEAITVTRDELQEYVSEVNLAYPALNLSVDEISTVNMGLTLFGEENAQQSGKLSFGKRSRIVDHAKEHDVAGLLTSIGVRATMARGVAEKVVGVVSKRLDKVLLPSRTDTLPVFGGDIEDVDALQEQAIAELENFLPRQSIITLVRHHGSRYRDVLNSVTDNEELPVTLPGSTVTKAEVLYSIREEMAMKLSDIVFRRTDLGTGSRPNQAAFQKCADIVAGELNWDQDRVRKELDEVYAACEKFKIKEL
jgi:glycerol-3-phosphate dehydrogenase